MLSAVLVSPGQVEVRQVEKPVPRAGEVRVRVEGCGVCSSNLAVWKGAPWFTYPLEPGAPGHEAFGVIDEVGEGVTAWTPGQRVAFLSSHGFAEYDVCDESCLASLPRSLDSIPFPGEPLACAMNVFRRSEVKVGDVVAIVGLGFLGALLLQLCVQAGARVIAISRKREALGLATAFGATASVHLGEWPACASEIRELTQGRGCDVAIEAAGVQETLDLGAEITRERGRFVVAGYHQDGPRQINLQMWNWKGIDVINAHERDPKIYMEGMRAAIEAAAAGKLDFSFLLTHRFPLSELGAALEMARVRPPGFVKAFVIP